MKNTLQLCTLIGLFCAAPIYAMQPDKATNTQPSSTWDFSEIRQNLEKLFTLENKLADNLAQIKIFQQQRNAAEKAKSVIHDQSNMSTMRGDAIQLGMDINRDRKSAQAKLREGDKDVMVTLGDCNDEDLMSINAQVDQFVGEMPIAQSLPEPKKVYKFIHDMDSVDNKIQDEISNDAATIAEMIVIDGENIRKREKFEKDQQKIVNAVEKLAEEIMNPQQSKLTPRNAGITTAILAVIGTGAYATAKTVSFEKAKVKLAGLTTRFKKSFARA